MKIKPECFVLSIDLTFRNYDCFNGSNGSSEGCRRRSLAKADRVPRRGHSQQGDGQRARPSRHRRSAAVKHREATNTRSQSKPRGAIFATWVKCTRSCAMARASLSWAGAGGRGAFWKTTQ